MAPIDPIGPAAAGARGAAGTEWRIDPIAPAGAAPEAGTGFGGLLGASMQSLTVSQQQAAEASRALAAGEAVDPASVVFAVERAQLAMQLASQIRTKAVEAAQTIFSTQV